MRPVLAACKLTAYLALTLILIPFQALMLAVFKKGPAIYKIPQFYHRLCCRLFNIKISVSGAPCNEGHVIFVGNHLSYLDIPVLTTLIPGSFVAKNDVEKWPLFGTLGRLQRTVFISRRRQDAGGVYHELEKRLEEQSPLIIFPEGTSSCGSDILPFKSTVFGPLLNKNIKIQPFTIRTNSQSHYAWHGDMTLPPHLWNFSKSQGAFLEIIFHEVLPAACFTDRKLLSSQCWNSVQQGLDLNASTK